MCNFTIESLPRQGLFLKPFGITTKKDMFKKEFVFNEDNKIETVNASVSRFFETDK